MKSFIWRAAELGHCRRKGWASTRLYMGWLASIDHMVGFNEVTSDDFLV